MRRRRCRRVARVRHRDMIPPRRRLGNRNRGNYFDNDWQLISVLRLCAICLVGGDEPRRRRRRRRHSIFGMSDERAGGGGGVIRCGSTSHPSSWAYRCVLSGRYRGTYPASSTSLCKRTMATTRGGTVSIPTRHRRHRRAGGGVGTSTKMLPISTTSSRTTTRTNA
jgi:hypothetical protein